MTDPQSTEFLKKLVSDRLKRIDVLLKEKKIEDAASEIHEIRALDPSNLTPVQALAVLDLLVKKAKGR